MPATGSGRRPLPALDPATRPADERTAYAVQDALHPLLSGTLGPVVGHKIGCTTAVMQAFLRIPNPCAGGVFASTVGCPALRHSDFLHVGVECEIVVRLARDLPAKSAPFDRDAVAQAVGACMAGMEIVDDRYVDYKSLDTPTLIADDFFDAGCVLGRPIEDWRRLDLTALTGVRESMVWKSDVAAAGMSWDIHSRRSRGWPIAWRAAARAYVLENSSLPAA